MRSNNSFNQSYPSHTNEDIQTLLASKMEFIELSSWLPKEDRPNHILSNYNPSFYHQEVFLRMMMHWDRMFLIHKPGTGKTKTAINVCEHLRDIGKPPKRVYILERGRSILTNVRNQIISTGRYYPKNESHSNKGYQQRLSRCISKVYTLQTYKEFTKSKMTDKMIEDVYSDCIIVVDEAHNLVNIDESDTPGSMLGGEDEIVDKNDMTNVYNELWRIFHIAKRTKLFVMTATPMMNSASDLTSLLNLLLPTDNQIPTSFDYSKPLTLKPYINGLVSYVPGKIKINAIEVGETIPVKLSNGEMSRMILKRFPMRGTQLRTYKSISKRHEFYISESEAATFVFPDGSFGGNAGKTSGGLMKYARINNDRINMNDELRGYLLNNLGDLSSKFEFVIQNELNPPHREVEIAGTKIELPGGGCSFYNFDFIYPQAVPFCLVLEAHGFERYMGTEYPFIHMGGGMKKITINKKKRYILVTSENISRLNTFLDLINSKENVNGEYVQVFVGSRVVRDGINLYNMRRVYVNPKWNSSSLVQAIMRVFRSGGFDNIVEYIVNAFADLGIDASDYIPSVLVYKMSSYVEGEELGTVKSSIDDYLYIRKIEEKSIDIDKTMEVLVDNSVDKFINMKMPRLKEIDYSTYEAYDHEIISKIKNIIKEIFSEESQEGSGVFDYTILKKRVIDQLDDLYKRNEFVEKAIMEIVYEEESFYNKYRDHIKLNVSDRFVYSVRTNSSSSGYVTNLTDMYYQNIIYNKPYTINEIIEEYYDNDESCDVLKEKSIKSQYYIAKKLLSKYVKSLESNIANDIDWWEDDNMDIPENIRYLFYKFFFATYEPLDDIRAVSEMMSLPSKTKGRKPLDDSLIKLKGMKYSGIPKKNVGIDGEWLPVVLVMVIDNVVWILNLCHQDMEWEEATLHESQVYLNIKKLMNEKRLRYIPDGMLYGIILPDGSLSIATKGMTKGESCSSMHKNIIISYLYSEGYSSHIVDGNVDEMRKYIIDQHSQTYEEIKLLTDKEIKYQYGFFQNGYSRGDLCSMLTEALEKNGRLIS